MITHYQYTTNFKKSIVRGKPLGPAVALQCKLLDFHFNINFQPPWLEKNKLLTPLQLFFSLYFS